MTHHTNSNSPTSPASSTSEKPAACPICKKQVTANSDARPFCSKRCRTIDLGKWLGGAYVISRPIDPADVED